MKKYRRRIEKAAVLDTPQINAAVEIVIAVKEGRSPPQDSMAVLAEAFKDIFAGKKSPNEVFGRGGGRPQERGITPAMVVASYIEQQRRSLEKTQSKGALESAKRQAQRVFVDVGGADVERTIDRDWATGRSNVESLSDSDLDEILRPHEVVTKNSQ